MTIAEEIQKETWKEFDAFAATHELDGLTPAEIIERYFAYRDWSVPEGIRPKWNPEKEFIQS